MEHGERSILFIEISTNILERDRFVKQMKLKIPLELPSYNKCMAHCEILILFIEISTNILERDCLGSK